MACDFGVRFKNPSTYPNIDSSLTYAYNISMKKLIFEWDSKKDKTNVKKHGVTFKEAQTSFHDEYAIQFFDPDHSEDEERYILLGTSFKLKTLIVCHCYRQEETIVRIISARKADKDEAEAYWSNRL